MSSTRDSIANETLKLKFVVAQTNTYLNLNFVESNRKWKELNPPTTQKSLTQPTATRAVTVGLKEVEVQVNQD